MRNVERLEKYRPHWCPSRKSQHSGAYKPEFHCENCRIKPVCLLVILLHCLRIARTRKANHRVKGDNGRGKDAIQEALNIVPDNI